MTEQDAWQSFCAHPRAEVLTEQALRATFVDAVGLEAFWFKWYLQGFVDQGYGKVKFLVGRPGSGKSHAVRHLAKTAASSGYWTVAIDAGRTRLSGIEDIYRSVAEGVDWESWTERAARDVIVRMGYHEYGEPPDRFLRWREENGANPLLVRRDVRDAVDDWLARADLDPHFMIVVRRLVYQCLAGEAENSLAAVWLTGGKLPVGARKALGVRDNVSRRNARGLLVSLANLAHAVGHSGLLVLIDNVQALASTTRVEGKPYYTRSSRDQAYEMIRQLLDDSPHMAHLMIVLVGDGDALADVRSGFPSYPALWARIQSEVTSLQVNRFADLVDLDAAWAQDAPAREELARKWRMEEIEPIAEIAVPVNPGMGLEWSAVRRIVSDVAGRRRTGAAGGEAGAVGPSDY